MDGAHGLIIRNIVVFLGVVRVVSNVNIVNPIFVSLLCLQCAFECLTDFAATIKKISDLPTKHSPLETLMMLLMIYGWSACMRDPHVIATYSDDAVLAAVTLA